MEITFIGDVHGKISEYLQIVNSNKCTFQIGDMGLGFKGVNLEPMPLAHRFIRGNHDSPFVCKAHHNYIDEYGNINPYGKHLFFYGGAFSIDRWARTEGIDYWHDEEISYAESLKAIQLFNKVKPQIVVSHDAPKILKDKLVKDNCRDLTCRVLQEMFTLHQPLFWIHGHLHISHREKIGTTNFIGLNELETFTLDIKSV